MQHTAAEVIAIFHRDLIAGVIAIVLITMGLAMLLLGALSAGRSRRPFVYTGLFAIAYGESLLRSLRRGRRPTTATIGAANGRATRAST